ncbi:MAG: DUF1294 domain-containing protein [Leptolyngbyaceae cyanobacterium RM1_405_57]|nr:DUF1294 domain-containing protein [Leptolyngbyaceae cyanobacterium RM1_405_57]
MKPVLNQGQLTTWKDDRGFGFIQPADGSQAIFLHISELKDSTRRPQVGDTIYYYAVTENGKLRAHKAFILGARRKPTSTTSKNQAVFNRASLSPFPVLETLLLSILPLVGSLHFAWTTANPLPLILYPVMSLLTFALYADDKSRAKQGSWRTPEKTLHLCELAGGWLGGFVAQRRLHHKSSKESYQFEFWVIVALHYVAWLGWLFLASS